PESMLAQKIEKWEDALPENVKLAYLPNPMAVRLRLSAIGKDKNQLKKQVDGEIEKLQKIIPDNIFGYDTDTLAGIIGKLLKEREKTLAIAESCTGGYISHLITSAAGSSAYFKGAVTAYSNEIKEKLLGVKPKTLQENGAVSEQVAREMVLGVKGKMNADYAISTTGIAGPEGGTTGKPVGTVWIAVAGENKVLAEKYVFGDNRQRNIIRSSQTALQMLRRLILKD
ncbi:MAG TPA: nicotinamide-nucleotide amidohydrolase family protein, partial [Tangfeifania sp.]|nr:nicotinamide-nucleotide amidohydrolase family protein [Tangfeifania sp.]